MPSFSRSWVVVAIDAGAPGIGFEAEVGAYGRVSGLESFFLRVQTVD